MFREHIDAIATHGAAVPDETLAALDGEYALDRAVELTVIGTRRYVRRQRSWFRRDPRVHWIDGADPALRDAALRVLAGADRR